MLDMCLEKDLSAVRLKFAQRRQQLESTLGKPGAEAYSRDAPPVVTAVVPREPLLLM